MKRLINFRAFLFVFIGAILGTVFAMQALCNNLIVFIIGVVLTVALTIYLFISYYLKKNTFLNKFIVCFLIGFFVFNVYSFINVKSFSYNLENINNAQVIARVNSVSDSGEYKKLILENCQIINLDNSKVFKLNGNISIATNNIVDLNDLTVGDTITFNSGLEKTSLIKDGSFNNYYYKYNIKYSCFVGSYKISFINGNLNLDENIRQNVKDILFKNLSYDNASIAYACVFGDKTLIDDNIYNSFSISGTAHILCVSGLHVGFLIALLLFLFKILKLNKKATLIVLSVILLGYCYLCGFSASVVRASIMGIVMCFASTIGTRYDSLNALSFAGIILLLIKPFYVFDLGFQLSFASCFGILLLMPSFTSLFKKINFNNKFSQAFSLTLCAQLGTFPIILHNFERLSFLSVCANIIIVPIFSILFSLLIVFILLNAIFPIGFLFKVIELGLNFIVLLTKNFGAVTSMILNVSGFTLIFSIIFYSAILFISKFINLTNKVRILFVLTCVCIFGFTYLFQFYPINYNESCVLNTSVTNSTILTNNNNEKILLNVGKGTEEDLAKIKKDLFKFKILKLDILILSNYETEMQNCVTEICNNYKVKMLYIPENLSSLDETSLFKQLKTTKLFKIDNEFYNFSNFTFKVYEEENCIYLNLMENNFSFTMLLLNNLNKTTSLFLLNNNLEANIIKFKYIDEKYINSLSNFDIILCEKSSIRQSNIYSLNELSSKILCFEGKNEI